MDFDKLLARVKGIVLQPSREWPRIAEEPETPAGLFKRYILILAALPPVFHFIKYSLIGYHTLGMVLRGSFIGGLWVMVLGYVASLVMVYVMAQIINVLAPTFEGQKSLVQALKVTAYASTAYWVAYVAVIVPWVGWLIVLAGGVYSIYLLYLGLPHTMHSPPEKSLGYTAISALLAILVGWILAALLGVMTGAGNLAYRMHNQATQDARPPAAATVTTNTQSTVTSKATMPRVEALGPERMRAMLPAKLDGYTRESATARRQNAMDMQLSQAQGHYLGNDGRYIDLVILDAAGAKAMLGMSGAMSADAESVTDDGFDKIRHVGNRVIHETWNSKDEHGEYTVLLGNRFSVRASGHVKNFDDLQKAVDAVDLDALAKLGNAGAAKP